MSYTRPACAREGVGRDSLVNATVNSLIRADERRLRTVAFPAIGTGVGGFPMEECAGIMTETVIGLS